ncbi:hypothetical protein H8356DRAFT_1030255 [Neocallimastix lanati (nom. inval.)]|nr:hypothetical protein H8356DRAFT_1030255 [Neocallimastix sp. JGI-2020a]
MIFIHKLKNWLVKKIYNYISNLSSSFFNIIFSIVRKFSPIYGSYFIIKVNALNSNTFKQFYDLLNDDFHSSIKINNKEWRGYSYSNDRKSNYNKRKIKSLFGISRDFCSCHLYSSSSFFNLGSSWNINGWNSEKRDGVMYLNSVFKLVCICLQETGNSKFLSNGNSPSIFGYESVFLRANSKIPGMRGLYIGVHSSYTAENAIYNYIISFSLTSFWNQKCSIGNIYFS